MAKQTKAEIIATNNYELAIERFNETSNNRKNYWWDCIEQIYNKCKDFSRQYILDPIRKTITDTGTKVRKAVKSKYDKFIETNGLNITAKYGEICYLFRFLDEQGELLCSKVGTTTRTVRERLIEELTSDTYKKMGATQAIVDRVYYCGELPAEGLESQIRADYIKKFPKAFKKNDRFVNILFDLDAVDKRAKEYLTAEV